jgi:hypothetical protein
MDGRRVNAEGAALPLTYTPGATFSVGRAVDDDQAFEGWLDEVRVYDRALTDDEIKALALGAN